MFNANKTPKSENTTYNLRMQPVCGSIGLPSYPAGHLQTAK